MTLFISFILIYAHEFSGAWYLLATIVWFFAKFVELALHASVQQNSFKAVMENLNKGIRGIVK